MALGRAGLPTQFLSEERKWDSADSRIVSPPIFLKSCTTRTAVSPLWSLGIEGGLETTKQPPSLLGNPQSGPMHWGGAPQFPSVEVTRVLLCFSCSPFFKKCPSTPFPPPPNSHHDLHVPGLWQMKDIIHPSALHGTGPAQEPCKCRVSTVSPTHPIYTIGQSPLSGGGTKNEGRTEPHL